MHQFEESCLARRAIGSRAWFGEHEALEKLATPIERSGTDKAHEARRYRGRPDPACGPATSLNSFVVAKFAAPGVPKQRMGPPHDPCID